MHTQLKNVWLHGDGTFRVEEKRFYIPVTLVADCPHCGQEVVFDCSREYLSYPTANAPMELPMYHIINRASGECHEFTVSVVLRISLEPTPGAE